MITHSFYVRFLCYIFPIVEMFTLNWFIPVEFALFDWFFFCSYQGDLWKICVSFLGIQCPRFFKQQLWMSSNFWSMQWLPCECGMCVCAFSSSSSAFFSKMFLRFLWQQSMQFIVAEQILFLFINLFVISRISVSFSTSFCLYYISSVPPQVFF